MKKALSVILAAAVVASALTVGGISVSAVENNSAFLYGDADLDGVISVGDSTLVQQASVGLVKLSNLQKQIADVDGDGEITVLDASCIQRYIAGYTKKTGKTGGEFTAQTQHLLLSSVDTYRVDYYTNEWALESTTNIEYQNAYPTLIEIIYSDDEIDTANTFFEYTFENDLPKTCKITMDNDTSVRTIEYDKGREYNIHVGFEDGSYIDTWYQYANGDGFFTSLFREAYTVGNEYFPAQFAEETDSVQVTVENGLIKKSINSGYYANWDEREPKKWLRFNGTYTAEYDDDGIVQTMTAYLRSLGCDELQKVIEVKKENGLITEAVVKHPDGDGALIDSQKFEFEYTDTEIDAARYSQMMNYFIIGSGSNYYNNIWY